MKPLVWVVCPQFGAASEVWLYRQVTGMLRHRVRVLTWDWQHPERFPARNCEVTLIPSRLELAKSPWRRRKLRLLSLMRGHGGNNPAETAWYRARIGEQRPDVILAQFGSIGIQVAPAARAEAVPLVVHCNGLDLSALLRSRYYRWSLRRTIPHVARFIVVAEYMRDALIRLGADADRIERIPYGVPLEHYSFASRDRQGPCRFLMIGRLTEKKRPDLSIRAFARVAAAHPDAQLTIIGDGELLPGVRRLIDHLGLSDRIRLLGAQPPDEVRRALQQADVFVQHSITAATGDMEGWPVAIAEAAASELPVVSTRHASIPEQVVHETTGLLCEEGDWETMGEHMERLAASPSLRRRMGQAAREWMARYDTAGQIQQVEQALLDTAGQYTGALAAKVRAVGSRR
jgi:colanic acid/amylovoran biosynthesis glycosyltransferase